MTAASTARDSAAAWIVCRGVTRDVVDGMVACPFGADGVAAFEDCLECRHLETLRDDRSQPDCATDE